MTGATRHLDIIHRQLDELSQIEYELVELGRAFLMTGNETMSGRLADMEMRVGVAKDAIREAVHGKIDEEFQASMKSTSETLAFLIKRSDCEPTEKLAEVAQMTHDDNCDCADCRFRRGFQPC